MDTAAGGKRTSLERATGRGVRMEDRRTQAKATKYWQKNSQSRRGTLGPWGMDQMHNRDTLAY